MPVGLRGFALDSKERWSVRGPVDAPPSHRLADAGKPPAVPSSGHFLTAGSSRPRPSGQPAHCVAVTVAGIRVYQC